MDIGNIYIDLMSIDNHMYRKNIYEDFNKVYTHFLALNILLP